MYLYDLTQQIDNLVEFQLFQPAMIRLFLAHKKGHWTITKTIQIKNLHIKLTNFWRRPDLTIAFLDSSEKERFNKSFKTASVSSELPAGIKQATFSTILLNS